MEAPPVVPGVPTGQFDVVTTVGVPGPGVAVTATVTTLVGAGVGLGIGVGVEVADAALRSFGPNITAKMTTATIRTKSNGSAQRFRTQNDC
ncbi:MAG TPA: hypothetical protein VF898_02595 [Chloroflexota bacterium]